MIVVIRPPANEAHYHNPESEALFHAVIERISQTPDATVVLLPRTERQAESCRRLWPELFAAGKIRIPAHAVDGLNLMWHSDLVISGGGTMNREAAALRVPVYSIFRGPIGAVDRYLASSGRLVLLESVEDVRSRLILKRRLRPSSPDIGTKQALHTIVGEILVLTGAERSAATGSTR
jgi:predicted glycosyltransferase